MENWTIINEKRKIIWLAFIILTLFPVALFSQNPSVQTSVDKNDILIGEQVKVKLKGTYRPNAYTLHWLTIPDSIPHFDIIDKGRADTIVYKDNSKGVEQTIIFTSFDSGRWTIPAFPINFGPLQDDTTLNLFTDSIHINVSYSPTDSTSQLRDIKPVIEVNVIDYLWYYIGGGILLLLVIIILIIRYLKKQKQKPAILITSKLSPYEEAMQELEKLKQYDLQKALEIKLYHIKLSEIFKRYLGRKQNINLLNRTTGDLLIRMTENSFQQETISTLATALRCCDAVKFAKYLPSVVESADCNINIKETINLIEHSAFNIQP